MYCFTLLKESRYELLLWFLMWLYTTFTHRVAILQWSACSRVTMQRRLSLAEPIHVHAYIILINTLRPRQNGRQFPRDIFKWKYIDLDYDFTEVCSQGSHEQYSSIDSDNGLPPAMRQALSEPITINLLTHACVVLASTSSLVCLNWIETGIELCVLWARNVEYWSWWRYQMETFSALLAFCVENSPVPGEFPAQRPVTRNFDVFFDLHLNKRLSEQPRGW